MTVFLDIPSCLVGSVIFSLLLFFGLTRRIAFFRFTVVCVFVSLLSFIVLPTALFDGRTPDKPGESPGFDFLMNCLIGLTGFPVSTLVTLWLVDLWLWVASLKIKISIKKKKDEMRGDSDSRNGKNRLD